MFRSWAKVLPYFVVEFIAKKYGERFSLGALSVSEGQNVLRVGDGSYIVVEKK